MSSKLMKKLKALSKEKQLYILATLTRHLAQAGQIERQRQVLTTFDFLQAKVDELGLLLLIVDYENTDDRELQLLRGALQLSMSVVEEDSLQLASQLLGRLASSREPLIESLKHQINAERGDAWLYPLKPNLVQSGGSLLYTKAVAQASAIAVTPDSHHFIAGLTSGDIQIWDLEQGSLQRTIRCPSEPINALVVTPDSRYVVAGLASGNLKMWHFENGEYLRDLKGHTEAVNALVVTSDGHDVISGSKDHTLKIWDFEKGFEIFTLTGHDGAITALTITSDNRYVISGSDDHNLRVWDIENGQCKQVLPAHIHAIQAVAVTQNRYIISAGLDSYIRVWDLEDQDIEQDHRLWSYRSRNVRAIVVAPQDKYIISGSAYGELTFWDMKDCNNKGRDRGTLTGHEREIITLAVTPDNRRLISMSEDGIIKVWNLTIPVIRNRRYESLDHSEQVCGLAVTPDCRFAISASDDRTLKVWDLTNGNCLHQLGGNWAALTAVAVTPDGRYALSASFNGPIEMWDIESGKCVRTLGGPDSDVINVVVTPDGQQVIRISERGHRSVWDIESGDSLPRSHDSAMIIASKSQEIQYMHGDVLAVTPKGRRLIVSSSESGVEVWDMDNNTCLHTLEGIHPDVVAVSPDGRFLISGSGHWMGYGELQIWSLESGQRLHTIRGHTGLVTALAVTPDGYYVVSASQDHSLKVWNLDNAELIANYLGESPLLSCIVAPDGRTIIAGEEQGRVHILRLENVKPCIPIVTAWYCPPPIFPKRRRLLWRSKKRTSSPALPETVVFGCPHCRVWSEVPYATLGTELPCPQCQKIIKLNTFTISGDWQKVAQAWRQNRTKE